MINKTELISDDNDLEILVNYDYETSKDIHDTDEGVIAEPLVYTELKSVEVVIGGKGTNILPLLHPDQKEVVIRKLNY